MNHPDTSVISRAPNYIKVIYSGEYQLKALVDLGKKVVTWAQQQGVSGVIIDLSGSVGKLSISDRYELVNHMTDSWPRYLSAAIIVKPSQTLKIAGFFWERMALSRGFKVSIQFNSMSAKKWILEAVNTNTIQSDY
ncbi:MAG: hypothetical protein HWE27_00755 [Gammaproteobacteria bacterium]|nr:hypothetical protein [Gammaproteobacteria bacterium]